MDAELRQQPTSDQGTDNAHDQIANEPKTSSLHKLACQPSGNDAHDQYDQQTFARDIHVGTSSARLRTHHCKERILLSV
jgi:hypothetical protein